MVKAMTRQRASHPSTQPSVDVQVGRIVLGPATPAAAGPLPQFVPPVAHSLVGVSVAGVGEFLNHLRLVRDSQAFKAEGANNFREWTMKNFGDRIGIWVDENL